jgi:translation initiation factor IF-2
MFTDRNILINDILGRFNISLEVAVDYLNSKGVNIEVSHNVKISYFEFKILQDHFEFEQLAEEVIKTEIKNNQHLKLKSVKSTDQTTDLTKIKKNEESLEIIVVR